MNEMPDSGTVEHKLVKVRKDHICIECRKQIIKGAAAWYFHAYYEGCGGWNTFYTCEKCKNIKDLAVAKYKERWDEGPAFGELFDYIHEKVR